jgi:HEAT repeat protein
MEQSRKNTEEKITEGEIKLFDSIVRSLNIAVESSALYNPAHPAVEQAVKNFKGHLDNWLSVHESLDTGVASDNLLLQNNFVREKNDLYRQVAGYLHQRGVIALRISRGVELKELLDFFCLIVKDAKLIKRSGGIASQIPSAGHIFIKEIDYRKFLAGDESTSTGVTEEERTLWQELTSLDSSAGTDILPESKLDFVMHFLKDQKRSSSLLNKVYKEALAKLEDRTVVNNFRATFVRMLKYAQQQSPDSSSVIKQDLTKVIAGLNPDFVANLFSGEQEDDSAFNLGQDFLKDLPEDTIADFMASLIDSEGKMSDNLFKLFDKLVPQESSSGSLVATLADKLFEKKLLNKNTLSQLQVSVKELFEANSSSQFISQMYKLTVETLIDKSVSGKNKGSSLSALAQDCLESLEEPGLQRQKIWLLLNILWQEDKPEEFKKFCDILTAACKKIIQPEYLSSIKESIEFFSEKLKPQQSQNQEIAGYAHSALGELTEKAVAEKIISFIPRLDERGMPDVRSILAKSQWAPDLLIEAYVLEKNKAVKERICSVIAGLGPAAAASISQRFTAEIGKEGSSLGELFDILKKLNPQEAHKAAQTMLQSKDLDTRLAGLENFMSESEEEKSLLLEIFQKEESTQVKEKIIGVLVKTNSAPLLNQLFIILSKRFSPRKYLLTYIRACGDFSVNQAIPCLEQVVARRPLLDNQAKRELRVSAVVSLGEIASPEAMIVLKKALNDRSESVRKIARLAVESCKDKGIANSA